MDCPSETQLAELADGSLPATGAARLQQHVDGCEHCQKALRGLVASEATVVERNSLEGGLSALQSGWANTDQLRGLVGTRVGEYRVEELIGSGGMGVVYRGVHPLIGKTVAIKVLRPELAADAENVKAMLAEARAATSIGHRGIVDVFAYGELSDGRHYMVMEYLNGEGLNRLVRREAPMPAKRVVELLDAILDSLEAAHDEGVVHRDLKPSNLYVVKQKSGPALVKLLDFGLAKRGAATGKTNASLMGTPGYMAPEQIRLERTDARTDLYSLGVIGFELATGRRPFKADTMAALLLQHTDSPPPRPSSITPVPKGLEQLLLELLEKNPERRPPNAASVRARLKSLDLELSPFAADEKTQAASPTFGPEGTAVAPALKVDPPQPLTTPVEPMPAATLAEGTRSDVSEVPTDARFELPRRDMRPFIIAGAAVLGVGLLLLAMMFASGTEVRPSREVVELPSPYAKRPAARPPSEVAPPAVGSSPAPPAPSEPVPAPMPAPVRQPVAAAHPPVAAAHPPVAAVHPPVAAMPPVPAPKPPAPQPRPVPEHKAPTPPARPPVVAAAGPVAESDGADHSRQGRLLTRVEAVKAHLARQSDPDPLAGVLVQEAEKTVKAAHTPDALRKAEKMVRELEHRYPP